MEAPVCREQTNDVERGGWDELRIARRAVGSSSEAWILNRFVTLGLLVLKGQDKGPVNRYIFRNLAIL